MENDREDSKMSQAWKTETVLVVSFEAPPGPNKEHLSEVKVHKVLAIPRPGI